MTLTGPDLLPEEWPPGWAEEFAAICDSNRGRLVRWLTAIFGPRDAEDIAQEALARLYVRPGLLDEDADPWPWLSVVARNVGRDMMRHAAYSTTVESGTLDQLPDGEHVHDQVVARDDAERLRVAIASLSPRDRALIRLRDVQGVPVGEIAALLRMNDNAVRQQLFRARKRLANAYLDLGGDRQLGLLGTLGLRCREAMRRYGRALDAAAPSATSMLSAATPAIAAILGGALFLTTTPAAGPAHAASPGGDDARPRTAAAAAGTSDVAAAHPPVASLASPSPSPFVHYEERVGDASVSAWSRDPLSSDPGRAHAIEVYVSNVPVVGYVKVSVRNRDGRWQGPVCRRLRCPTAVPTPPAPSGGR